MRSVQILRIKRRNHQIRITWRWSFPQNLLFFRIKQIRMMKMKNLKKFNLPLTTWKRTTLNRLLGFKDQRQGSSVSTKTVAKASHARVDSKHTCIYILELSHSDALLQGVEKLSQKGQTLLYTLEFILKKSRSHAIYVERDSLLRVTWKIMSVDTINRSKFLSIRCLY